MDEQMRQEAKAAYETLTPSAELAVDVLIARTRLGETLWTFNSNATPALKRLEAAGLIHLTHGIIEKTVRASLTAKGLTLLSDTYVPPILEGYKKKKQK